MHHWLCAYFISLRELLSIIILDKKSTQEGAESWKGVTPKLDLITKYITRVRAAEGCCRTLADRVFRSDLVKEQKATLLNRFRTSFK